MKSLITTAFFLTAICQLATAQWTPVGNDIKNTNTGNVAIGLGTSAPLEKLDLDGRIRIRRSASTTAGFAIGGDALTLRGWGANNPYIEWVTDAGTRQAFMGWYTDRLALRLENGFAFGIEGGKVGIGTATPTNSLHVNGAIYTNAARTNTVFSGQAGDENANLIGSQGYWALRSATDNSYNLDVYNGGTPKTAMKVSQDGSLSLGVDNGLTTGFGTQVHFLGAGVNGDPLYFQRYNSGSNQSELRLNIGDDYGQAADMFVVGVNYWSDGLWHPILAAKASGAVGIGTTDTGSMKLAVEGKIGAREVNVTAGAWPDYVFNKEYKLRSIDELASFIGKNNHLPEVPTASDVKANGVDLGDMNSILLKKIEELSLYVIDLKKENDKLKEEVAKINEKLK